MVWLWIYLGGFVVMVALNMAAAAAGDDVELAKMTFPSALVWPIAMPMLIGAVIGRMVRGDDR